jgi:hypothetical protein
MEKRMMKIGVLGSGWREMFFSSDLFQGLNDP